MLHDPIIEKELSMEVDDPVEVKRGKYLVGLREKSPTPSATVASKSTASPKPSTVSSENIVAESPVVKVTDTKVHVWSITAERCRVR
jgi:hypothetical protein